MRRRGAHALLKLSGQSTRDPAGGAAAVGCNEGGIIYSIPHARHKGRIPGPRWHPFCYTVGAGSPRPPIPQSEQVGLTHNVKQINQTERRARSRRNTRVSMRFPVTVEVPAGGGRTRVMRAETVVVSHAGATLDMDETVPLEMGLQVIPPFGGTILAEVNGAWVDSATGRHRVSIRLIDPVSWTSPERFHAQGAPGEDACGVSVHPRVWQMLAEYAAFLGERSGVALTPEAAAGKILEDAFLSDVEFQDWFAAKIMEDLQAWEELSVRRA